MDGSVTDRDAANEHGAGNAEEVTDDGAPIVAAARPAGDRGATGQRHRSLEHLELYTLHGLLTILWHGDPEAEYVVLMGGRPMGGLLGPADGLYHDLGVALAALGIGTMRIGYRTPNDLEM